MSNDEEALRNEPALLLREFQLRKLEMEAKGLCYLCERPMRNAAGHEVYHCGPILLTTPTYSGRISLADDDKKP